MVDLHNKLGSSQEVKGEIWWELDQILSVRARRKAKERPNNKLYLDVSSNNEPGSTRNPDDPKENVVTTKEQKGLVSAISEFPQMRKCFNVWISCAGVLRERVTGSVLKIIQQS